MTTYNTYAECKIKHPQNQVVTANPNWYWEPELKGKFIPADVPYDGMAAKGAGNWIICNPADHCMSIEVFLASGYRFVPGDFYLETGDVVEIVNDDGGDVNTPEEGDHERFVLSAKALNDQAIEDFYDPEFEQVEWKIGDDCVYKSGDEDFACKFIGMHPGSAGLAVVWNEARSDIYCIVAKLLSKPETPEQKKEPEQAEWNGEGLPPVGAICEALDTDDDEWRLVRILDAKSNHEELAVTSVSDIGNFGKLFWAVEFRKPETPEQKKEREINELIDKACVDCYNVGFESLNDDMQDAIACMISSGYRKPE